MAEQTKKEWYKAELEKLYEIAIKYEDVTNALPILEKLKELK